MARLYDLARMTTATTGTGTVTLGSAVSSFLTFAQAGVADGETVTYAIKEGANREIGRGVYTSSGTTLTRATILRSTNSNAAITLAGAAEVFIAAAAEDIAPQTAAEQSTVRTTLFAAPYDAMRRVNFIINGAQEVSQQFAATTRVITTADNNNNTYVPDMWGVQTNLSGTWNAKQSTDAPTGFTKSFEMNAAGTQSLASGDFDMFATYLEGTRVATLAFGTSSAPTITIGFWIKASRTGTATVGVGNAAPALSGGSSATYRANVTVNAVDTWEFKTVTLAGDTAHTWDKTNLVGMTVWVCIGAGSTQQSSTVGSWDASTPQPCASNSQTHFLSATNDYVRITGVFLVPTADTIVAARSVLFRGNLADELDDCMRYYETSYNVGLAVGATSTLGASNTGHAMSSATFAASAQQATVYFKKRKRASPTVVIYSPATGTASKYRDVVAAVDVNIGQVDTGENGYTTNASPNAASATMRLQWHWAASARL